MSNDILFKSINNQTIDQKSHPSVSDVYFMEALKMRESINNFRNRIKKNDFLFKSEKYRVLFKEMRLRVTVFMFGDLLGLFYLS